MGLVKELQRAALDESINVDSLLRKALVAAEKLQLNEFAKWILLELDGYMQAPAEDFPQYRILRGRIEGHNIYHGWGPVMFQGEGSMASFTDCYIGAPVDAIHVLSLKQDASSSSLEVPFTEEQQRILVGAMDSPRRLRRVVNPLEVLSILNSVRNAILRWSLRLDADGITGDDLTFTSKDRDKVRSGNYNIQIFFGDTTATNIQQGAGASIVVNELSSEALDKIVSWVSELKTALEDLGLDDAELTQATAEIRTVEDQLNSPQPKSNVVEAALASLRRILENAAGSAVASSLLGQLGSLF